MPQTSTIAFALIVGFVVFITVKGELPAYLCVLGIGKNCPQPGQGSSLTGGSSGASSGASTGVSSIGGLGSPGSPGTVTSITDPFVFSNTGVDYTGTDGGESGDPSSNPGEDVTSTVTYD
jgi:hypothetical protein